MIKAAVVLAVGLALTGLGAGAASAFSVIRVRDSSNGKWYPVRWKEGTREVQFKVSDRRFDLLPNLLTDSFPMDAIRAAFQSWSFSPVQLTLAGMSGKTDVAKDGVNLITFADTPKNRDVAGSSIDTTLSWYQRPGSQAHWNIIEADVVFNPTLNFSTDGSADAVDVQAVLTHELGHTLGLDHSAIAAASMWPTLAQGSNVPSRLELDDIAALNSVYVGATDPDHGKVTGQVLTSNGDPVFGAYVVALDPQGVAAVAAFTERDGSYTLPWLAAGLYYIYAEPLHPMLHADSFNGDYYKDIDRDFRTTFLGGNFSQKRIRVVEGQTLSLDPIRVDPDAPALTLRSIGWSPDGSSYSIGASPVQIRAGDAAYLAVAGDGLDTANQIGVTGRDVTIDGSQPNWGTTSDGYPSVVVPLYVAAGAAPGARTLLVTNDDEIAAFTGAIKIVAP